MRLDTQYGNGGKPKILMPLFFRPSSPIAFAMPVETLSKKTKADQLKVVFHT